MKIINKKIEELTPYDHNPRNNHEAIDYVANSIKQFGFKVPLVIDKENTIVCGHTRYEASKKLGLKEIPCIIADDLTDEQIRAFRLADNKVSEFSQWDYVLLDEELQNIDLSMNDFGFDTDFHDIDWADVEDLTEENYEEPSHNMLECPQCHHIDRDIHFKKIKGVETTENKNISE